MMSSGMPVRVAVTGAAGFLGQHIMQWLREAGCVVRGVDDYSGSVRTADEPLPMVDWCNVADEELVDGWQHWGADVLIHAAAFASEHLSDSCPRETLEQNVIGTMLSVEAACRAGVGRVILLSSCAVYGDAVRHHESVVPQPVDPYGCSKLAAESVCRAICESYGVPWVALRLHNVYGPGQVPGLGDGRSVVAIWCEAICSGQPIRIVGTGEQVRSWCFVDDLRAPIVDLCGAADVFDRVSGGPINCGPGVLTTVEALAADLREAAGALGHPTEYVDARREPQAVAPVLESWDQAVGPAWNTPLLEGLRRTWEWYADWRAVNDLPSFWCPDVEIYD